MIKEEFYNVERNEQETTIVIDYADRVVIIYTSRYSVYNKLSVPDDKDYVGKKVTSGTWRIAFNDKRVARVFSKGLMIGNIK